MRYLIGFGIAQPAFLIRLCTLAFCEICFQLGLCGHARRIRRRVPVRAILHAHIEICERPPGSKHKGFDVSFGWLAVKSRTCSSVQVAQMLILMPQVVPATWLASGTPPICDGHTPHHTQHTARSKAHSTQRTQPWRPQPRRTRPWRAQPRRTQTRRTQPRRTLARRTRLSRQVADAMPHESRAVCDSWPREAERRAHRT